MSPNHPRIDLAAHCACGALRATVRGPAYVMLLCSCEDCQKSTGTGHSAVFCANIEDFSLSGDLTAFARNADSGAVMTRYFCPTCGTPVYGVSSRAPRLAMLPIGLFGARQDWFHPNQLIFARSHAEWDTIAAELPQYVTYRDAAGA